MTLDLLGAPLFTDLDRELRVAVEAALADMRAELIDEEVRTLEEGQRAGAAPLGEALGGTLAWARHPGLAARHRGDWVAAHLLGRAPRSRATDAADRAALINLAVVQALDGQGAADLALLAGSGATILDLRAGRRLGADQRWAPIPRVAGWSLPLFEDCVELGFAGDGSGGQGAPGVFAGKLAAAYDLLVGLWPQAVPWVRALVPAIVGLGAASPAGRSESYEAGGPLLVSPRGEPWDLAESVLHELQHHRFKLWARGHRLRSRTDHRYRFLSPYRSDPRRLFGVHLGLHAFTTVNELRYRAGRSAMGGERQARAFLKTHFSNLFAWRSVAAYEVGGEEVERYLAALGERLLVHGELADKLMGEDEQDLVDQHFARRCQERDADGVPLLNTDPCFRKWGETMSVIEETCAHTFTGELAS
jgi:hypothetical protein